MIEYLAPERADLLEYDLTGMIYDLVEPDKPVVAVLGDLPLMGSRMNQGQSWRRPRLLATRELRVDGASIAGKMTSLSRAALFAMVQASTRTLASGGGIADGLLTFALQLCHAACASSRAEVSRSGRRQMGTVAAWPHPR